MQVKRTHPNAILPYKTIQSDAGYDISIIRVHKKIGENTIMFDTGLQIKIDPEYYTEIVPRSSIIKTGWMLSNSIGIIDSSYRGNLYIVLTKVDKSITCDLDNLLSQDDEECFPFRGFQLIIRKQYDVQIEECDSLDETARGQGGFGSTG